MQTAETAPATTAPAPEFKNETGRPSITGRELAKRAPKGAVAVIIAELRKDESESQSDYWGHKVTRRVVIGWSDSKRENFGTLRKAAATFPETAEYGPGLDIWRVRAVYAADVTDEHNYRHYKGQGFPLALPGNLRDAEFKTQAEAETARAAIVPVVWASGAQAEYEIKKTSIEHRENYSMGGGNYLGRGRHSGWVVRREMLQFLQGELYELPPEPVTTPGRSDPMAAAQAGHIVRKSAEGPGYVVMARHHTKHNRDYWQVEISERLERSEWERLTESAKQAGGWYSKAWAGVPGGWAFWDKAAAINWAAAAFDGTEPPQGPQDKNKVTSLLAKQSNLTPDDANKLCNKFLDTFPEAKKFSGVVALRAGKAAKWLDMAERLRTEAERKRGPRLENTPKRNRQGMSARIDATQAEAAAFALERMADAMNRGNLPPAYDSLTKAQVQGWTRRVCGSNSYYDVHLTNDHSDTTPAAVEFRRWVASQKTDEDIRREQEQADREKIKKAEEALRFSQIPGFFPTPPGVIELMLSQCSLGESKGEPWTFLEPSAGKGDIADAIKARFGSAASVVCMEINLELHRLVTQKGHVCNCGDFLRDLPPGVPGTLFDRILMNPPFENDQDIRHVQRAYACLKPGGRLVAIMGAGAFNVGARKIRQDFAQWFEEVGGEAQRLDEGSFSGKDAFRQTGVSTFLVVIDKAE